MKDNALYILNSQVGSQELLHEIIDRLMKIECLMAVTNAEDFLDFGESVIRTYFWIIRDIIFQLLEITENLSQRFSSNVMTSAVTNASTEDEPPNA